MVRQFLAVFSFCAVIACADTATAAVKGCDFDPDGANKPPAIPKSMLLSQNFTKTGPTQARYAGILRSGEVVVSTHTACENRGAHVVLIVPSQKGQNLQEKIHTLMVWYLGKESADVLSAELPPGEIEIGWKKMLSSSTPDKNRFLEYPWADVEISATEGYVLITLDYYTS